MASLAGVGAFWLTTWFWLGGAPVIEQATPQQVILSGDEAELKIEAQAWAQIGGFKTPQVICETPLSSSAPIGSQLGNRSGAPCRVDVTVNLPSDVRQELGRSFSQGGPNCFATALKIARMTTSFRGVDGPEMQAFANAFCDEVTGKPQAGDIGVYSTGPDPAQDSWVHAFIHLTPTFVIEKQGVDYWGATPVTIRPFKSVDYRVRASPECRRYAPDIRDCENKLTYYRCEPARMTENLDEAFKAIDDLATKLLDQKIIQESDLKTWDEQYEHLTAQVHTTPLTPVLMTYAKARLKSLRLQRQFFRR